MGGRLKGWMVMVLLLGTMAYAIAEEITVSSYYPSPRGRYRELIVNNATIELLLDVDGLTYLGNDQSDQVQVTGNVGISNVSSFSPQVPLNLRTADGPGWTGLTLETIIAGTPPNLTSRWSLIAVGDATARGTANFDEPQGTLILREGYHLTPLGFDRLAVAPRTGNVGIGTYSPQNRLDVEGSVAIGASYSGSNTAPANGLLVEGNVGIGTTAPDQKLTVMNAGASYLNVRNGTREILLGVDGADGILSVMTNHDLSLRAGGNTEKMRIAATGNVGIGTNNPQVLLQLGGNATAVPVLGLDASGLGGGGGAWLMTSVGGGAAVGQFWLYNPTGVRLAVAPNGNVGVGTITPQSTLQVGTGYFQLPVVASEPPNPDCDTTEEVGRMILRVNGPNATLYICKRVPPAGATWSQTALP